MNLGILVFVDNILNLIPLIYVWIVPRKYFSAGKTNTSDTELTSMEKEKNENIEINNNINEGEENNNIEENKANFIYQIYSNFVEPYNEQPLENSLDIQPAQSSFRHLYN